MAARKATSSDGGSAVAAPARKKVKASPPRPKIYTFRASHSPKEVQLLSNHTLHDLCDTFCKYTSIGDRGEDVYSHMWNITVESTGACYESGDYECMSALRAQKTALGDLQLSANNATLVLKYDYGSTSMYAITFRGESDLDEDDNEDDFPAEVEAAAPAGYAKFSVPQDSAIDLNTIFPELNEWAFADGEAVALNFFNPPHKNNHGFLERGNGACRHMVLMPAAAPAKDLAAYLYTLNSGVSLGEPRVDGDGCYQFSWYSMVVLPGGSLTERLRKKWIDGADNDPGFVDVKVVPSNDYAGLAALNATFPRLAALAGFTKDPRVPKGWMTYEGKTLRICKGKSLTPKSCASRGTAFLGDGQHQPADDAGVLFTVDADADSLHDLFCIAEGLLRTL